MHAATTRARPRTHLSAAFIIVSRPSCLCYRPIANLRAPARPGPEYALVLSSRVPDDIVVLGRLVCTSMQQLAARSSLRTIGERTTTRTLIGSDP
jgi:hypothetical protein